MAAITKSISLGSILATLRAFIAAAAPKELEESASPAICLDLIPVRSTIQSSLVSTNSESSSLVRIRSGKECPYPATRQEKDMRQLL